MERSGLGNRVAGLSDDVKLVTVWAGATVWVKLAEVLGLTEKVRSIPIVEPEVSHSIGLVVPHRNPLTIRMVRPCHNPEGMVD